MTIPAYQNYNGTPLIPAPPNLLIAPADYSQQYQDQFNNALRLYFAMLDSPGISSAAGLILNIGTLPTESSLTTIARGTVYRDTTAGNVLKVKV